MNKLAVTALTLIVVFMIGLASVPLVHAQGNAQGAACVETYTVAAGDTLGAIAQKYLGAIEAYSQIFTATNEAAKSDPSFKTIADANVIEVGQKVCIPAKAAGAATTPVANTTPSAITPSATISPTVTSSTPVTATETVTTTLPTTTTVEVPTPTPGTFEGTYIASTRAADAPALLWQVFLGPNSNASWLSNYVGKGTINATGVWAQTSANTLALTLIQRDGQNIGEKFIFEVQGDKLVATQYNQSLYGSSGIALYKADAQVTGTVTYLQKISLPDDAVIEVYLLDVSKADTPAEFISGVSYRANGDQVPLEFSIPYASSQINAGGRYIVQAFISSGDKLLFRNTNGVAVITNGAPTSNVEIVVEQPTP